MLLRTLFQFLVGVRRPDRLDGTPIDVSETGYLKAFREFTPPPRSQSGSMMRLGRRAGDRLDRIAIVPFAGVKVP
ncbi:hypothetical protein FZ025_16890 [Xanthomonas hyacinthi]|uniref:Uncharacterized protein n=1 Tax=Xanthomonas hyacinthi TaxID=56455 RepID=A0A2S7F237_9XANT|nr:hypothetical protein [Xanthomonas hyacinthi]KLD78050.1 hypothetical protein Y886_12290 [Xanthomonas hyacinthi DSM 19077]PPU99507.1 hypothetical protein XhyaCFBP1156_02950 [Xanthomonas hyacinthi]QGY78229.1 hypothetical protein FZ025_16890 [Xanthomonas hyacinthi]